MERYVRIRVSKNKDGTGPNMVSEKIWTVEDYKEQSYEMISKEFPYVTAFNSEGEEVDYPSIVRYLNPTKTYP